MDGPVGAWNSGLAASFLFGAALGGWVFGWLGDRLGRVRAMVFSVLTYASFTGLCGLAQNPWQLAGLRFLASLGMGGEWSLGVALVMESWPQTMRPLLAGLIGAAANVGFLLTVPLVQGFEGMGMHVDAGGWRWVLGVCALPALLTFFLRVFVPESEKWMHAAQSGPRPSMTAIFTPALRAQHPGGHAERHPAPRHVGGGRLDGARLGQVDAGEQSELGQCRPGLLRNRGDLRRDDRRAAGALSRSSAHLFRSHDRLNLDVPRTCSAGTSLPAWKCGRTGDYW